ncbi:YheC/YheD family protein [Paenibacillus sp. FSL M8-0334]|uniref:YheC/YheD family protein n=1 Tax=Paenibacillus TaxID=44249 RepID=UPI0030F76181
MAGRQLASKWLKTEALLSDPQVAPYIPATQAFGTEALTSMLEEHGMVVIKPIIGTGGNGVIRILKSGTGYMVTYKRRTVHVDTMDALMRVLARMKLKREYMIQQGIHLAKIRGRPLDYRVKVVKERGAWRFKAMVGRLASPGLIVTNICKGGSLLRGTQAMVLSLPRVKVREKRREMRGLTRHCIALLESKFPGIAQLGFDYGIDQEGKIWILEVNTRPS